MKRKKILLVSLDALGDTDLEYVRTLPNFSKIMREGAWCGRVNSVYPSLTFPSHASIATGCVPDSHGIVNNYMFLPFEKLPRWNSYAGALKRKAVWDYAARGGKRVLSMSWPVSAGADMAYSMPELSPAKPKIWNMATFGAQLGILARYGTPGFALKHLLSRRELPRAWFLGKQPQLDQAMIHCFERAVRQEDFDIALLHIYGMDDAKHRVGIRGPEIRRYLRGYDRFVGRLMEYCEERTDENVTLMVTGDHGQKDVRYAIYGNMILEDMGLSVRQGGRLKDYQVYLDSCDGMAYLYGKDEHSGEACKRAAERFGRLPGVKAVMAPEEFIPLGCDRKAAFVLEAADGYSFESGYEERALSREDRTVESHYRGLHGYLPDQDGYRTMFFCYGRDVAACEIGAMGIIDILPTMLSWLELEGDENMDGRAVEQIWRQRGSL